MRIQPAGQKYPLDLTGDSGTSFPTAAADGQLFYRTDTRILYEYNASATRWLSLDRKYVPGVGTRGLNGVGNVTGVISFWSLFEDVYIESWVTLVRTSSTNDGSNFTTASLIKQNPAQSNTTVSSFSTAADSVSTNIIHTVSIAAVVAAASFPILYVNLVATGSPNSGDWISNLVLRSAG